MSRSTEEAGGLGLERELEAAVEIAEETGKILLSYFDSDRVDARAKGPRDVVTAADLASERHVLSRLEEAFAGDGLVAEEGSRRTNRTGRVWYVDPLDGTMNYSRGIPIWCVSIGLVAEGRPVLGVIHDPIRAETFRAARGVGAWRDETRICCTDLERLSEAFVHVTIDFNEQSMLEGLEDVRVVAPSVLRTRNIGSAALALAYVAAGRLDAMLHRSASTWDYTAGVALILEAGGTVSDMQGETFSEDTVSMVAGATQELHRELLALVLERPPA